MFTLDFLYYFRKMKYLMILASIFTLFGCQTKAQTLQIATIYTEPKQVTREVPETGKQHTYTTSQEVTERLVPAVYLVLKEDKILRFRIQGNISSSGHRIRKVSKIRFEQAEQFGNSITLKYYVVVKHIPGKEGNTIAGYNYSKEEKYKIPINVKVVNIEVYEEHPNQEPKLIAKQKFDFFAKI
ncbi:hypothetical protein HX017_05250 [Myroides marinus]|uniref:Uncharacterized protein n=1 Tax=Myroides marinus TaxID=703342 RepID=A0A163XU88_9FLAO|nr:hypothetical protein [Myroides marinus]KZE78450.1 hypothetical protein AV926_12195 [Myroides marinus]MDM1348205.1 hypothetical protein [Myroides marinus]MDM1364357.1 hypothetical protein [Myroides marinus]MDM1380306.1 hypothetical protein [Myroides marinus]MDM1387564.1 hypothetical protein [Myroides marinus]